MFFFFSVCCWNVSRSCLLIYIIMTKMIYGNDSPSVLMCWMFRLSGSTCCQEAQACSSCRTRRPPGYQNGRGRTSWPSVLCPTLQAWHTPSPDMSQNTGGSLTAASHTGILSHLHIHKHILNTMAKSMWTPAHHTHAVCGLPYI